MKHSLSRNSGEDIIYDEDRKVCSIEGDFTVDELKWIIIEIEKIERKIDGSQQA